MLENAQFVGGALVEQFENEFARFCRTSHCVGVASGTDALRFALIAAGVRTGDTVVTVPNTFIATTEAISQAGARPDFVDVDEGTYNMDSQKLQEYFETQCRFDRALRKQVNIRTGSPVTAVVPVHLYGQMADMDAILALAQRYNLFVIEDACQAHGAAYYSRKKNRWKKAGSMGIAAAFSFYPGKNLGACGEAGAVTTNDSRLAAKIRMLRDHGQLQKYNHETEGYNGRLDAIQAGILRAKLKLLRQWNRKRRAVARSYQTLLDSHTDRVVLPSESPQTRAVYHLYVVRVRNRDQVRQRLAQANIATQIHYPVPLHLQKAYGSLGFREGDYPVAEKAAREILSLPMYPHLEPSQQEQIAREVTDAAEGDPLSGNEPLESVATPRIPGH